MTLVLTSPDHPIAFVRLRQILADHADLAQKLAELEKRYDRQVKAVFDAVRELVEPPPGPQKQIVADSVSLSPVSS